MHSVLACQALTHYSDFDGTSESGLSDLSYVHPYRPKKSFNKNKNVKTPVSREVKLGARAMRRYENEAYLNTLAVIAETDDEDAYIAWPDSIASCSAFTKLFEDQSLRAVWDMFIQLSEIEQAKLLATLRDQDSDTDDSDLEILPSGINHHHHHDTPKKSVKHRCRKFKRTSHSRSVESSSVIAATLSQSILSDPSKDVIETSSTTTLCSDDDNRKKRDFELEDRLSNRFLSLLNDSAFLNKKSTNQSVPKHSHHHKHILKPIDLCLLKQVEIELRKHFSRSNRIKIKRWTPSISLLSSSLSNNSNSFDTRDGDYCSYELNILRLNSFQRLLIHSIASYLGLHSYSTWSSLLGERQLWVENIPDKTFHPPRQHFVNLIRSKLDTISAC